MQLETKIKVKCSKCNEITEIPIKYFYDCYEGLFFCRDCGNVLDVDSDYE